MHTVSHSGPNMTCGQSLWGGEWCNGTKRKHMRNNVFKKPFKGSKGKLLKISRCFTSHLTQNRSFGHNLPSQSLELVPMILSNTTKTRKAIGIETTPPGAPASWANDARYQACSQLTGLSCPTSTAKESIHSRLFCYPTTAQKYTS